MTRAFRPSSPRRSSSGVRRGGADAGNEAGRPELAEKESEEASILQVYLPPPALSESEVHAIVREAIDAGATEIANWRRDGPNHAEDSRTLRWKGSEPHCPRRTCVSLT